MAFHSFADQVTKRTAIMRLTARFRSAKPASGRPRATRRTPSMVPTLQALEDRTALSTLIVLNNFDTGDGSLRDAIGKAKDGDTVIFAPALYVQTITLAKDPLTINKDLDIEGPGAGLLAVSGNDSK